MFVVQVTPEEYWSYIIPIVGGTVAFIAIAIVVVLFATRKKKYR